MTPRELCPIGEKIFQKYKFKGGKARQKGQKLLVDHMNQLPCIICLKAAIKTFAAIKERGRIN